MNTRKTHILTAFAEVVWVVLTISVGYAYALPQGTCAGACGSKSSEGECWCDEYCAQLGDCCYDACPACNICASGSCIGNCGNRSGSCYCDTECHDYGDCCEDAADRCDLCNETKVKEITGEERPDRGSVFVDCNLFSTYGFDTQKTVRIEGAGGSGVTIDCGGGNLRGGIDIRTLTLNRGTDEQSWQRPENVAVRNCRIYDSISIRGGMTYTGEPKSYVNDYFKWSSRHTGHTDRARDIAPRNISFNNVEVIVRHDWVPIYVHPGVTRFQLKDSAVSTEFPTELNKPALYLDAESCCSIIKNNEFHVRSAEREVISVDGSSSNRIIGNTFRTPDYGGIYLYRNCGEDSIVRHNTPSFNHMINNLFLYSDNKSAPAVYVGARDGRTRKGKVGFCNDDSDSDLGSGGDDRDNARYNVVMQNQMATRPIVALDKLITSKNADNNAPNEIGYNETVAFATFGRRSGCYIEWGDVDFVEHGSEVFVTVLSPDSLDALVCEKSKVTCNDNQIVELSRSSCSFDEIAFDCRVSGNNGGCQKTVSCPNGETIVGARAACNLEYGEVTRQDVKSISVNTLTVIRESDKVDDGYCYVGHNVLKHGEMRIKGIFGGDGIGVGCKEHDKNGGDCHVRGAIFCR